MPSLSDGMFYACLSFQRLFFLYGSFLETEGRSAPYHAASVQNPTPPHRDGAWQTERIYKRDESAKRITVKGAPGTLHGVANAPRHLIFV